MTCEQLKDITKNPLVKLIDVRTPQEFQQARLTGAVNLPLSDLESIDTHASINETILVYCRSGQRSEHAKNILSQRGYDVRNIGGIMHHMQCIEY